mgnify:CR=1 FL=1
MIWIMECIEFSPERNFIVQQTIQINEKTIAGNLDIEYKFNDKHLIGGQLTINALFGPGQTITTTEVRDEKSNKLEQILYARNEYYMQKEIDMGEICIIWQHLKKG